MNVLQILNTKTPTTAVVLRLIDNSKNERQSVLLFNNADGWFKDCNHTDRDKQGFFAGAIMKAAELDKTAIYYDAKAYVINGSTIEPSTVFCGMGLRNGSFEPCLINDDGNLIFIN